MVGKLRITLLMALYDCFLDGNRELHYDQWASSEGIAEEDVDRTADELIAEGLAESRYIGRNLELTWPGVQWVEQSSGLVPALTLEAEAQLRNLILLELE